MKFAIVEQDRATAVGDSHTIFYKGCENIRFPHNLLCLKIVHMDL